MVGRATIMTGNDDLGQYPSLPRRCPDQICHFFAPAPALDSLFLFFFFLLLSLFCRRWISNFRTELQPLVVDEPRSAAIRLPFVVVVDLTRVFALNYPSFSDTAWFYVFLSLFFFFFFWWWFNLVIRLVTCKVFA